MIWCQIADDGHSFPDARDAMVPTSPRKDAQTHRPSEDDAQVVAVVVRALAGTYTRPAAVIVDRRMRIRERPNCGVSPREPHRQTRDIGLPVRRVPRQWLRPTDASFRLSTIVEAAFPHASPSAAPVAIVSTTRNSESPVSK